MRGTLQLRRAGGLSGLLALALLSGCNGENCCVPPTDQVLSIQLAPTNSGDGQTDTISGTLANPLRVLVLRDQWPVQGVAVSWTALTGSVSPSSSMTDASGLAQATWTLGDSAGAWSATASLLGVTAANDTVPLHVSFSAIARPGAPVALVFRPGPSNAFVGRLILVVQVAAVDRRGNVATDFHGSVTVALAADPSGASLTGTTSVDAVNGVAPFTNLSLDRVGAGYTLTASASGLPSVTSAAFEVVAPGSGQIAFVSGRDGNDEIYVMNADGSDQINLTSNPASDCCAIWSPDGSRVAFVSTRDRSDGSDDIYVMNANGSGVVRLTTGGAGIDPAWSPDGTKIAFESGYEIYVMNADGSGQVSLTNNPATDDHPKWSPDGTRIAFESDRDGNYEIYVINADGSGLRNITNNPAFDYSPAWSPDGSKIAFISGRRYPGEIYVMNADGSGVTPVYAALASAPTWSPDGTRIAFSRVGRRGSGVWIYVMNADGSAVRQLTSTGKDSRPVWSSDGTRIAFVSSRDGNSEIYVMNADGSGVTRLTDNPASDTWPAWAP